MFKRIDFNEERSKKTTPAFMCAVIFIQLFICTGFQLTAGKGAAQKPMKVETQQASNALLKNISVDMENVPLAIALSTIAGKGQFELNYNSSRIPVERKVSIRMAHAPALEVLKKVLAQTGTQLIVTGGGQFAVVPLEGTVNYRGTITGRVCEGENNRCIPGVFIRLIGTPFSSLSDENGEFKLVNIPAGVYDLECSAPGFKPLIKKGVVPGPAGMSIIEISLEEQPLRLEERIEVLRSHFHVDDKNPVSVTNITSEEIRLSPGTAGCVSRMLRAMPGITATTDSSSELVIRGGSPLENGFYIDNIEIPNINHLPAFGSNGGIYSALHPALIRDIDFYSGGYSADYGDRLSSITEITFREGNRAGFKGELDFSTMMTGALLEGPLAKGKGAFLLAFRKSLLNITQDIITDLDSIPDTLDSHIKVTFDVTPQHKINALYLSGSGTFNEKDDGINIQEDSTYSQDTAGINWMANWNERLFSNTSLSYSSLKRSGGEITGLDTRGNKQWEMGDSSLFLTLRNTNHLVLDTHHTLEFGLQLKHETARSRHIIYHRTDASGNTLPGSPNDVKSRRTRASLFLSYTSNSFKRLTSTIGLRTAYSFDRHTFHVSPRFSASFRIGSNVTLNGGFGIFYQALPMNYLAYTSNVLKLKDMKATHYILGLEYFSGTGSKLRLEAYNKEYKHLPVNPDFPCALFSDWVQDRTVDNIFGPAAYFSRTPLVDKGSGYSRGIELLIREKFTGRFYGIFSATLFRSRYKDLSGTMRSRAYDNGYVLNLAAVYKPGRNWEFSAKWTFMGGAPYTPIDQQRSLQLANWTLDLSKYYSSRYPAYSSLNLRVNKRFHMGKSSSLLIYLEILNLLDRENVASYWWTGNKWWQGINEEHQLPVLPIIGIEFVF
jgi:hypothetical protein